MRNDYPKSTERKKTKGPGIQPWRSGLVFKGEGMPTEVHHIYTDTTGKTDIIMQTTGDK